MPLVRIDLLEGRSDEELAGILDAAHRALVAAFGIPLRDRYQIVSEHSKRQWIIEDTGLDFVRSDSALVISLTSRPRMKEAKLKFYELVCKELKAACSIEANDVIVCMVINTDEDWSFGNGRAQFITGEL